MKDDSKDQDQETIMQHRSGTKLCQADQQHVKVESFTSSVYLTDNENSIEQFSNN